MPNLFIFNHEILENTLKGELRFKEIIDKYVSAFFALFFSGFYVVMHEILEKEERGSYGLRIEELKHSLTFVCLVFFVDPMIQLLNT